MGERRRKKLSNEDFEAEKRNLVDEFEDREWMWWMAGANFDYVVYGTVGNPENNLWVPPQVTQSFKDKKYHGGSISKDDYDTPPPPPYAIGLPRAVDPQKLLRARDEQARKTGRV